MIRFGQKAKEDPSEDFTHFFTHLCLQFISNQCTLDVSFISGKWEVHPIISVVKKTLQKCNPPDFRFYLGKLNDKNFPHMV